MAWKVERWFADIFPGAANIYSEYRSLPSRELAIVAAAILDAALVELISLRLLDVPKESESFLGVDGDGRAPAGSFGARIQLGVLLAIITVEDAAILRSLKDLRNAFAHRVRVDFLNPAIQKHTSRLLTLWRAHLYGLGVPEQAMAGVEMLAKKLPKNAEAGGGLVLAVLSVYQAYFHRLRESMRRIEPLSVFLQSKTTTD